MRKIKSIVIHHSLTQQPDIDKLISSISRTHKARLHKKPNWFNNHGAYHYIINYDWEIRYTRPLNEIWYHASNWPVNQTSIWICLSGNFDIESPTDEHYTSLAKLIKELKIEYWDLSIHLHSEFANKTCPGKNFDFNRLMSTIMSFYKNIWEKSFKSIPEKERIFKNPEAFLERTKDLDDNNKFSELTYLIAILTEKLWKKIK